MCSRYLKIAIGLLLAMPVFATPAVLRVCSDPNNLPFSNKAQEGFENKLATLVAADLNTSLEYTWWSQRKSFARKSLDENACDLIMGVTAGLPDVLTTEPYYRSTYVFVSRADRNLQISSLMDSRLSSWRIGVHVVGDDYAPPAVALAHRGITKNIIGFSLFGSYGASNPPAKLIDAVASRDVDVAIVWGPFAGYFAQSEPAALTITPVQPVAFLGVPFEYSIAAAVKEGNQHLVDQVNVILRAHTDDIRALLHQYGIPQIP